MELSFSAADGKQLSCREFKILVAGGWVSVVEVIVGWGKGAPRKLIWMVKPRMEVEAVQPSLSFQRDFKEGYLKEASEMVQERFISHYSGSHYNYLKEEIEISATPVEDSQKGKDFSLISDKEGSYILHHVKERTAKLLKAEAGELGRFVWTKPYRLSADTKKSEVEESQNLTAKQVEQLIRDHGSEESLKSPKWGTKVVNNWTELTDADLMLLKEERKERVQLGVKFVNSWGSNPTPIDLAYLYGSEKPLPLKEESKDPDTSYQCTDLEVQIYRDERKKFLSHLDDIGWWDNAPCKLETPQVEIKEEKVEEKTEEDKSEGFGSSWRDRPSML